MAIFVVCPGCRKRFEVSERFAGQTGPCPSCKAPIKIPKLEEQVVIHGVEEKGPPGKARPSQISFKPVARKDVRFEPVVAAGIAAAAVVVAVATYAARGVLQENTWNSWILRGVGLLLISPPLVIGGYSFLRDDELAPYRGKELYVRSAILALVFVVLWAGIGWLENSEFLTGELPQWLVAAPPFFVVGALAALACLDLNFGSGFFLYCFYLAVTMILRWLAGLDWIWNAGISVN